MPQQVKLYQIPTATLAEQAIQAVQSALASLTYLDAQNNEQSWFSEIWGMCELSEEKRIPHFRISTDRYESAQPNNRQKAIGFFLLERDEILPNRDHLFEVSLIVWLNTKAFLTIDDRAIREYFITAIGHFIRRNHPIMQLLEVYRDKKDVWQGIDHDSFLPSDVPYSSFRIKFDLEWSPECGTITLGYPIQIEPAKYAGLMQISIGEIDLVADELKVISIDTTLDLATIIYPSFYLGNVFLPVRLVSIDTTANTITIQSEIDIIGGRLNIIGKRK